MAAGQPRSLTSRRDRTHQNLAASVAAQAKPAFTDLQEARSPRLQHAQPATGPEAQLGQVAFEPRTAERDSVQ